MDYLSLRGSRPGPLFCVADGSPVSRYIFIYKLSMAIKYCGLDPSRYKGHSFRIGAASYAADAGTSDALIRALGDGSPTPSRNISESLHYLHS